MNWQEIGATLYTIALTLYGAFKAWQQQRRKSKGSALLEQAQLPPPVQALFQSASPKTPSDLLAAVVTTVALFESRITELEGKDVEKTKQIAVLQESIAAKEARIAELERQLQTVTGERDALLHEVEQLRAEVAELRLQLAAAQTAASEGQA